MSGSAANGSDAGGGSGGTVLIKAQKLIGQGLLAADGGAGRGNGGGGAGGRMRIFLDER